jgi:hypothetical protein
MEVMEQEQEHVSVYYLGTTGSSSRTNHYKLDCVIWLAREG